MANRFTDTNIWEKAWFRKASLQKKVLWGYLKDRCDHAGIFEIDVDMASFYTGFKVTEEDFFSFDGRTIKLKNGKGLIVKFCEYQYKGRLSSKVRAHKSAIDLLKKNNVNLDTLNLPDFSESDRPF